MFPDTHAEWNDLVTDLKGAVADVVSIRFECVTELYSEESPDGVALSDNDVNGRI